MQGNDNFLIPNAGNIENDVEQIDTNININNNRDQLINSINEELNRINVRIDSFSNLIENDSNGLQNFELINDYRTDVYAIIESMDNVNSLINQLNIHSDYQVNNNILLLKIDLSQLETRLSSLENVLTVYFNKYSDFLQAEVAPLVNTNEILSDLHRQIRIFTENFLDFNFFLSGRFAQIETKLDKNVNLSKIKKNPSEDEDQSQLMNEFESMLKEWINQENERKEENKNNVKSVRNLVKETAEEAKNNADDLMDVSADPVFWTYPMIAGAVILTGIAGGAVYFLFFRNRAENPTPSLRTSSNSASSNNAISNLRETTNAIEENNRTLINNITDVNNLANAANQNSNNHSQRNWFLGSFITGMGFSQLMNNGAWRRFFRR